MIEFIKWWWKNSDAVEKALTFGGLYLAFFVIGFIILCVMYGIPPEWFAIFVIPIPIGMVSIPIGLTIGDSLRKYRKEQDKLVNKLKG